jgi:hypothetical protein
VIIEPLRAVLGSPEFAVGWWFGLAALVGGLAAVAATRTRPPATLAIAGLLFAAGVAAALGRALGLPAGLAIGLVVLVGAGAAGRLPAGRLLAPLAAVPGAWLVVSASGLPLGPRMRALLGLAVVAGGWLLVDFDATWRSRGLGPVLLAISAAGVYTTVPDTEQALVALGVALPLALLAWPWPLAALGRPGAYAAAGALLWVVGAGGAARESSVVGGIACLGLLVVEPAARRVHPACASVLDWLPEGPWGAAAAGVLHLGLVYLAARVAGLRPGLGQAVAIVLAELVTAVILALAAATARRRVSGARR